MLAKQTGAPSLAGCIAASLGLVMTKRSTPILFLLLPLSILGCGTNAASSSADASSGVNVMAQLDTGIPPNASRQEDGALSPASDGSAGRADAAGPDMARPPDGGSQHGAIAFELQSWVYDSQRTRVESSAASPGRRQLVQSDGEGTIAYLRDFTFTNGSIECELAGGAYLGVSFRVRPQSNPPAVDRLSEDVYVRIDNNERAGTIQYYPHGKLKQEELHQAPHEVAIRTIRQDEWVHIRLEVNGKQLKVYLDRNATPVQVIDDLMHDHSDGSVGLRSWGGRFANLKVTRS